VRHCKYTKNPQDYLEDQNLLLTFDKVTNSSIAGLDDLPLYPGNKHLVFIRASQWISRWHVGHRQKASSLRFHSETKKSPPHNRFPRKFSKPVGGSVTRYFSGPSTKCRVEALCNSYKATSPDLFFRIFFPHTSH